MLTCIREIYFGQAPKDIDVFCPEETNDQYQPSDLIYGPVLVPAGTGIRVVQGAVASVGNIGFNARFALG